MKRIIAIAAAAAAITGCANTWNDGHETVSAWDGDACKGAYMQSAEVVTDKDSIGEGFPIGFTPIADRPADAPRSTYRYTLKRYRCLQDNGTIVTRYWPSNMPSGSLGSM